MKAQNKKTSYRTAAGAASILLMLAGMLSCQSGVEPLTEESKTESQTESPVTEECEYTAPERDYDGADFTIVVPDYRKSGAVWKAQNYCEMFAEDDADVLNTAIYQRNQIVSELFHLNILEYPVDDLNDTGTVFQKAVMSGDDLFDFAMVNGNSIRGMLATNSMYDLRNIDALDLSHSWWDQNMLGSFTLFDHTFFATGDISLYLFYSPICFYFNQYLIDQYSLDDPYALVESGAWTIDKMITMARGISTDLNGDGRMDLADQFGIACENGSFASISYGCGVRFTKIGSDGLVENTTDIERMASIAEKALPILSDKNISLLSTRYTNYSNPFVEVLLPMFVGNQTLFFTNQILVGLDLRGMEADFGIIPMPKYDTEQKEYCTPLSPKWMTCAAVPVTAKDPEMSGEIIEAFGYYGQTKLRPAFYELTLNEKIVRDADSVKMLDIIYGNIIYDLASFNEWNIESSLYGMVGSKSTDFASRYAKIENGMNAAIQKSMDLWASAE